MKKVLGYYLHVNLIVRIAVGLVIGSVLGVLLPSLAGVGILGDFFVGCLKSIAPLLVFVLIISSIANSSGGIGKRFKTVIVLYYDACHGAYAGSYCAGTYGDSSEPYGNSRCLRCFGRCRRFAAFNSYGLLTIRHFQ